MARSMTDFGILNISMSNFGVKAISGTGAVTGPFAAFQCVEDTVFNTSGTTVESGDGPLAGKTHPAGMVVVMPFIDIQLVSGSGYGVKIN